jgi:N-methylhydantoinase A
MPVAQPLPRLTIGVDIGGTFTDVVVLGADGSVRTDKAPTTPDDFAGGVLAAIEEVARSLDVPAATLVAATQLVKHGSTVATNALITRQGARVGLITTHGFEDTTLIMRAVGRVDGLPEEEIRAITTVTKPEPLVPRARIRGVRERIDAYGTVVVPLNEDDVREAAASLVGDMGVEAIAVSLLHAWRDPTHERRVRAIIEETLGARPVFVSLGSDLSGVAGEYARTNTAIANAFVGPAVARYVASLEGRLRALGFTGRVLAMQGNGGLTGHDRINPIATLQSGPAGGMLASAFMSSQLGHARAITADMGGTSFDVGIVDEGYWRYADEPIFDRFRILQPITDIISIGAGGGTIAHVDPRTGRLGVGPSSAGADPGPVAYGKGGTQPTVTDADLVLGYLDPDFFLGGRRRLDLHAAREAIRTHIAEPLGLDVMEAAAGIVRIVDSKMSDLIRREVVKSGHLPEDFVLYAFGGASPVHAVGYARDLGVQEIVVFATSSVFSAFGVASADIVRTRLATRTTRLPAPPAELDADLERLEQELLGEIEGEPEAATATFRRYVTLRFQRQTTGVEIPLPFERFSDADPAELETSFLAHYRARYGEGVAYREAGLELAGIRVDLVAPVTRLATQIEDGATGAADDVAGARKGTRDAWFGTMCPTPVYALGRLPAGAQLVGPAIVESPLTTIVLPPGADLFMDASRNLRIRP